MPNAGSLDPALPGFSSGLWPFSLRCGSWPLRADVKTPGPQHARCSSAYAAGAFAVAHIAAPLCAPTEVIGCAALVREAVHCASRALEYVLEEAKLCTTTVSEARLVVSSRAVSSLGDVFDFERELASFPDLNLNASCKAVRAALAPVPAEAVADAIGELRWAMRVLCVAG